nr:ADP-ribosylation factor-like protein [Candidatus Sigynarchaeota archaeon]
MTDERHKQMKSSFDDFLQQGTRALKAKKHFTALSSFNIAKSIATSLVAEKGEGVSAKDLKKLDKLIDDAKKSIAEGKTGDMIKRSFLSRLRNRDTAKAARPGAVSKTLSIFLFGLDRAGKTTFVEFLNKEKFCDQTPTLGLNVSQIVLGNLKFEFNDLGGQQMFRGSWMEYWKNQSVLVFMVDVADAARFSEAKDALWSIIKRPETAGKPLLILLNKIDLPDAKDAVTVKKAIDFYRIDREPTGVFEISIKQNKNLDKPLNFLASIALEDDELQEFVSEETARISMELGQVYTSLLAEAKELESHGKYEQALNPLYKAKLIQDEIAANGISGGQKKALHCLDLMSKILSTMNKKGITTSTKEWWVSRNTG